MHIQRIKALQRQTYARNATARQHTPSIHAHEIAETHAKRKQLRKHIGARAPNTTRSM